MSREKVSHRGHPSELGITHLLLDVIKGVGRVNSEADQDDMGVRVGKRTETVIVLLTSGIPKSKLNVLAVNLDIGNVVLEDGGDVHLGVSSQYRGYNATLMLHHLKQRLLSGSGGAGKGTNLREGTLGEDAAGHRGSVHCTDEISSSALTGSC